MFYQVYISLLRDTTTILLHKMQCNGMHSMELNSIELNCNTLQLNCSEHQGFGAQHSTTYKCTLRHLKIHCTSGFFTVVLFGVSMVFVLRCEWLLSCHCREISLKTYVFWCKNILSFAFFRRLMRTLNATKPTVNLFSLHRQLSLAAK